MRRANGTGSVYKRSDAKHRRAPWLAVADLGHDENGKRKRKIIARCQTKREAQEALEKYRYDPKKYNTQQTTMGEVWEAVKASKEAQGKPLTNHYTSAWNRYVKALADTPMSAIKTMHLQKIIDTAPVGITRKTQILTIFHLVYNAACANDIVDKDYSSFVKLGKLIKSTKHRPFTTQELRILWENAELDPVKIVLIMTYTGMRQAELASMELQNVHLKERYMIGGVKTEAGKNRTIPIAKCILPFVTYFYRVSQFKHSPYLIAPDKGKKIYARNGKAQIPLLYTNALPGIGIENHTSHDSRHTFITMTSNYGIPDSVSKRIVGHTSSGDVHEAVYTHKTLTQFLAAVDKLPYGTKVFLSPEEEQATDDAKNGSQMDAT